MNLSVYGIFAFIIFGYIFISGFIHGYNYVDTMNKLNR